MCDVCYDRDITFRLKCFLNDLRHSLTQNRRKLVIFYDSCSVTRPWDFSSCSSFYSYQNQFLGEVLSSQIEKPQKKSDEPLS